ncbi:hypothetical protein [Rugamonas sp. DEMB1]|uniref:hypothetical protein n=1 Tax=Rugamonas sp. DEMB1 TaxID=3039386 RepID=UPI00244BE4AB|nr:hypothetical protein [Rugamonas sp. DEMB1]WGG49838.1 hypothetical protein QC826_25655 [Rugamonas sp. DEMB1]
MDATPTVAAATSANASATSVAGATTATTAAAVSAIAIAASAGLVDPLGPLSPYALPFVVAVTGHRDLHPDDVAAVGERLFQALELIAAALPCTPIVCLSALADGADQLFAEQVLRLQRQHAAEDAGAARRIDLVVPLPMPFDDYCDEQAGGAAARARDGAAFARARQAFAARFLRHSAGAAKVFELPPAPPAAPLETPLAPAEAAYARLTRYLGVHAHVLLAVWDGQTAPARFPRQPGGTLDLVRTLLDGVRRDSHPRSSNRFAEPPKGRVLHVYSRRARASSAGLPAAASRAGARLLRGDAGPLGQGQGQEQGPGQEQEPGQGVGHWAAPAPHWPGVQAPPLAQWLGSPMRACERHAEHRAWRALTARVQARLGRELEPAALAVLHSVREAGQEIDTFNTAHRRALLAGDAGAGRYAAALRASAAGFLASLGLPGVAALPAAIGLGLGPLLHSYSALDVQAERSKRFWRRRWLFLASAAVLASASSTLRLLNPAHGDLIESLVFAVGAFCAVGTYLWVALSSQRNAYLDYRALAEGMRFQMYWLCAGEPTLVSDHYVHKFGGEVGWLRHALDACMVIHPVAGLPARRVLHGWIDDQLGYLNGAGLRRRQRGQRRSVAFGNDLLLAGLLFSVAAVALVLAQGHARALSLALLIAGMKLATGVGAAWLSLVNKLGHGETLSQAAQLRGVYGRARQALRRCEAGGAGSAEQERRARDLLFALGKAVLEENANWLAAHQQRRLSWHGR